MSERPRVVLDTNIVVSAVISPRGFVAQVFPDLLLHLLPLVSEETLGELRRKLASPKFRTAHDADAELLVSYYLRLAARIAAHSTIRACRDPKDDMLLELAVDGGAAYLITGDRDPLALDPFRGARILTPRAVVEGGRLEVDLDL